MYSSKLEGYTIKYTDTKEFEILTKELFKNEIYSIDLKSDSPVIIDCGAHLGLSIIYFKKLYPASKITALEPNPIVFELLKDNIETNAIDDIELMNKAADTQNGNRGFFIDTDQTWLSTGGFIPNSWQGSMHTKEIKVATINIVEVITNVLNKQRVKKIDLLKLDIEGHEYTLLKYLYRNSKLNLITNLTFEYHPMKKNKLSHLLELLEMLSSNFKKIEFVQEGKIISLEDVDIENLLVVKCSIM